MKATYRYNPRNSDGRKCLACDRKEGYKDGQWHHDACLGPSSFSSNFNARRAYLNDKYAMRQISQRSFDEFIPSEMMLSFNNNFSTDRSLGRGWG